MLRRVLGLCLALWSLGAVAAWNEPHVAGTREHPLLKHYPQASVSEYDYKDFDSAEIVTQYRKGTEEPARVESVEGKVSRYSYAHKPNTSLLEIVRQYENALRTAGFSTVVSGKGSAYPGLPEVSPDDVFGSFRLERNGKPAAYVQVLANYNGGPDYPESRLVIVELGGMEQKLEANADSWFNELSKSGHVAVYGLQFDTGKASLRPQSDKTLAEVKKLLDTHSELALRIEGHTDNAGSAGANQKLSLERAAAVKAWLVKNGVRETRLTAQGFGDARPLADNKTEEGRARNRRVELVRP